jgi:uncharacterized membrane protein AbrB (regulator of aidB expression)
MERRSIFFWLNLTVGILGLFVGVSYLLKMFEEIYYTRDLVIGVTCTLLATGWLIYVFFSRKVDVKPNGSKI